MAKGQPPVPGPPAGPGIYSATYSNIPVYEYQFGADFKEHVMRRRADDWINATHILKAAGFDKPSRTRILERDVQKLTHEKIQGGYGKYQGTWIPLESGAQLAEQNSVYEKLRPIFEFHPGNDSPPPAPKHTTNKPKVPKKPAVPKFNKSVTAPPPMREASYDNISNQPNDDETPDDTTVASQSFMGDAEDYNVPPSQQSTGHRKRKREDQRVASYADQQHTIYADELLDYFMLSQQNDATNHYPDPPPNFQPNWPLDNEEHTALSWACSMGDVDVMKQLLRFGADIAARNIRGETPFMRSVLFVNCYEKRTFPVIAKELFETVGLVDDYGSTVIHHAAALTISKAKQPCARYYLDIILNKLGEIYEPAEMQRLIDAQDIDGNTACHLAAQFRARKCVRALIGRGASTSILNKDGQTVEDLIIQLNSMRHGAPDRYPQASSSPYAPAHRLDFPQPSKQFPQASRLPVAHHSEAAMTVESKIAPTMMEKFKDLAKSFDEELVDLENPETDARKILKATNDELSMVQGQIEALLEKEEVDGGNDDEEESELAHLENQVLSLIEQQQSYTLRSLVQIEDSRIPNTTINGNHNMTPEQQLAEKNEFAVLLAQEMEKRKLLVKALAAAKAREGGGEKAEEYRTLLVRCLVLDQATSQGELEANLDQLLEVLVAEKKDGERQTEANGEAE